MAAAEFTSAGVFAVVAEIMLDAVCVDLITVVTGGVGIIQGRTILLVIIFVILVITVVVVIVALIVTNSCCYPSNNSSSCCYLSN